MTTQVRHTVSRETLAKLFSSAARAAVLRVFMVDPRRAYYQRQIEASTGFAIRGIQRELERLVSIDLLYRHMEGNRAYYRVDLAFPLFDELRGMVLKSGDDFERLRAGLAIESDMVLAFLSQKNEVLAVSRHAVERAFDIPEDYTLTCVTMDEFENALLEDPGSLETFLRGGVDLLGRRDDIVWRQIETAGFEIEKGKGVP